MMQPITTRGVKRQTSLIDEYPDFTTEDPVAEDATNCPIRRGDEDENDVPEQQTNYSSSDDERLQELVFHFDSKALEPAELQSLSIKKRVSSSKSVRFAENDDGGLEVTIRVVKRIENPDLWWKKADMRRIRKRCRDSVMKKQENSQEYIKSIEEALARFDKEGESTRDGESRKLLQTLFRNYETRGLESHIVRYTSVLCQRHSMTVIEAARSGELDDEALRRISLLTSRGGRCFALRLAACDRLKVQLSHAKGNSLCSSKNKLERKLGSSYLKNQKSEKFHEKAEVADTLDQVERIRRTQGLTRINTVDRSQGVNTKENRNIDPDNEIVPDCCDSSSCSSDENDVGNKATVNASSLDYRICQRQRCISMPDLSDSNTMREKIRPPLSDSTPARPKLGKVVHFSKGRDGKLDIDIREFEGDHHPDMWWSTNEITRICKDCRLVVQRYQMRNIDYIDTITCALECQTEDSNKPSQEKALDRKLLKMLVMNEDARGLEPHILEYTQVLSKHVVSTVVEAAHEMKLEGYENSGEIIREVSEKLSRPALFLAQKLAACDWLKSKQEYAKMQDSLLKSDKLKCFGKQSRFPESFKTSSDNSDEITATSNSVLLDELKRVPSLTVRTLVWRHANIDTYPDALLPDDGDITLDERIVKSLTWIEKEKCSSPGLTDLIAAPKLLRLARLRASCSEGEKNPVNVSKNKKNTVRFAETSGSRVMVQTRLFEKDDEPEVWWTTAELSKIRQECSSVVQCFQSSNSNYLSSLKQIFDGDTKNCEPPHKLDGRHLLRNLLQNFDARGLETHVLRQARECSRKHVQYIVNESIRLREAEDCRRTDIPILLRQRSLKSGQGSCRLALKLAACDWLKSQQSFAEKQECFRWTSNERSQPSDVAPRKAARRSSVWTTSHGSSSTLKDCAVSDRSRPNLPIEKIWVDGANEEDQGNETKPPQKRLLSRASARKSIGKPGLEGSWRSTSRKNLMVSI